MNNIIKNADPYPNLVKPKVIAYDLDLTIHDVIEYYNKLVNETRKLYHLEPWNDNQFDQFYEEYGFQGSQHIFKHMFDNNWADAYNYFVHIFDDNHVQPKNFMPHAEQSLQIVRNELKLPMIAVTNCEENLALKILTHLDSVKYFDHIIGINDERPLKPDPQILLEAINKIDHVPSEAVWFIGDSISDLDCARNAGCTGLLYQPNKISHPEEHKAHAIVDCHRTLVDMIKWKL